MALLSETILDRFLYLRFEEGPRFELLKGVGVSPGFCGRDQGATGATGAPHGELPGVRGLTTAQAAVWSTRVISPLLFDSLQAFVFTLIHFGPPTGRS